MQRSICMSPVYNDECGGRMYLEAAAFVEIIREAPRLEGAPAANRPLLDGTKLPSLQDTSQHSHMHFSTRC